MFKGKNQTDLLLKNIYILQSSKLLLESSNEIQSFWNNFQNHSSVGLIHDVLWFGPATLQHNQLLLKLVLPKWKIASYLFFWIFPLSNGDQNDFSHILSL